MTEVNKKILLLLLGGLALGCVYTPGKQWYVLKTVSREWQRLDKNKLRRGLNDLCRYNFINKNKRKNGSIKITLTRNGKWRALNIQLENVKNKKEKWDGKWRLITFDIPEKWRRERDSLRHKLRGIGFRELQKSVFITPIKCEKEMFAFIDFFELKKYVRFGVLEFIDNEKFLRQVFSLNSRSRT